jgi:DNA-directed RNA polymerase subunit RPC12/RpoP
MSQEGKALRCPYCGAYYSGVIPQGANYVNCQYCGTSIQVVDLQQQEKLLLAERVIRLTENLVGRVIQEEREARLFDKNRITKAMITEARNFATASYLALLILGAIVALNGVISILHFLSWPWYLLNIAYGLLIWGVIALIIGGFGVLTALTVWRPKLVNAIGQGRYSEAYHTASSPANYLIGFICGGLIFGIIPAILLYLTKEKLSKMSETLPPPPLP